MTTSSQTTQALSQDADWIAQIQAGGTAQETAIRQLYQKYFHLALEGRKKYHQLNDEELVSGLQLLHPRHPSADRGGQISGRKHPLDLPQSGFFITNALI